MPYSAAPDKESAPPACPQKRTTSSFRQQMISKRRKAVTGAGDCSSVAADVAPATPVRAPRAQQHQERTDPAKKAKQRKKITASAANGDARDVACVARDDTDAHFAAAAPREVRGDGEVASSANGAATASGGGSDTADTERLRLWARQWAYHDQSQCASGRCAQCGLDFGSKHASRLWTRNPCVNLHGQGLGGCFYAGIDKHESTALFDCDADMEQNAQRARCPVEASG